MPVDQAVSGQAIALLATQRSGTHALGYMFEKNSVRYLNEVFHPDPYEQASIEASRFLTYCKANNIVAADYISIHNKIARDYLSYLTKIHNPHPFVMDIKYNSLHTLAGPWFDWEHQPLLRFFQTENIRIIHLIRRNALLRYLSRLIGSTTKIWHDTIGQQNEQLYANTRVAVDIGECLWFIKQTNQMVQVVSRGLAKHPNVLTIYYEEIFADGLLTEEASRTIGTFIGRPLPDRMSTTVKAHKPYHEMITNWRELCYSLKANGLGDMITPEAQEET